MAVGERSVPALAVEAEEAAVKDLAAQPVTLSELLLRAREAADDERKEWAAMLNEMLEKLATLAAPERDRQVALVLELLEKEQLSDLTAPSGVQCRAAAIEAVLRVGYPWAL